MDEKIALVTHVLDFVGPPAVETLLGDGRVVAQDPAFRDAKNRKNYDKSYPEA